MIEGDKIRLLSLFSGIGAFEKSLTNINIDYDLVGYSEIDKYASTAYSAIHGVGENKNLGDIRDVNTSSLAEFDLMTYGFPCFSGNTLVMTENGYKKIKNIYKGDKVLTHTRKFKKVLKTMKRKTNEVYKIKALGQPNTLVTSEHPYFVKELKYIWNNQKRTYERKFSEPKWKMIKNVSAGDYIGFPISFKKQLPSWNGIKYKRGVWKKYKIKNNLSSKFNNKNFWWIIGRYIGDGWYINYKRKNRNNSYNKRVIICCNRQNNELKNIKNHLDDLFSYSVSKERTVFKIHIVNMELVEWIKQFGKGASNKRLTSDIFNLPIKYLNSFLNGYVSADGYKGNNGNIKIDTVSEELAYGLQYIIHKTYKTSCRLYYIKTKEKSYIEGRKINQKNRYQLVFKKNKNGSESFYKNNYIWTPIRKIAKLKKEINVYNLEVENDNSYTANNVAVHNCTDISLAGKRKGFSKGSDTDSSLLWEAMRIAEDCKPKYMIAENVKNLIQGEFRDNFYEWLDYLDDMGYNNYSKLMNAKNWGVPQNRERVFIVSIRKDIDDGSFQFPISSLEQQMSLLNDDVVEIEPTVLRDVLEDEVDEKYYLGEEALEYMNREVSDGRTHWDFEHHSESDGIASAVTANIWKGVPYGVVKLKDKDTTEINKLFDIPKEILNDNERQRRVYDAEGISPSVLSRTDQVKLLQLKQIGNLCGGKWEKINENCRRVYSSEGISPTVHSCQGGNTEPKVSFNCGIRKLIPLECWRLMGFEDEDYHIAKEALMNKYYNGNDRTDSQMYKMVGNSIAVPCVEHIFYNLF